MQAATQTFNAAHRTFPHKSERVEPLTTVWQQGISGAALNADPLFSPKARGWVDPLVNG